MQMLAHLAILYMSDAPGMALLQDQLILCCLLFLNRKNRLQKGTHYARLDAMAEAKPTLRHSL